MTRAVIVEKEEYVVEENLDSEVNHPVVTGIGAAAGVIAGAGIGMAAAGPLGAAIGAAIGAIPGAVTGESIAETLDFSDKTVVATRTTVVEDELV